MIGNRVRVIFRLPPGEVDPPVSGVLHALDVLGAVVWRDGDSLGGPAPVFIPMQRIHSIIDLGRAP